MLARYLHMQPSEMYAMTIGELMDWHRRADIVSKIERRANGK